MDDWFYIVTESMIRLGLRGTELAVFAVLNGYSQRNAGCFFGTRQTLADRCGVTSKRTIDAALESLIQKGMIRRYNIIRDGKEMVAYEVRNGFVQDVENLPVWGANSAPGGCNFCTGGGAISAPMEKKDKKTNLNNIKEKEEEKEKGARFRKPTVAEVSAYCRERHNAVDPQTFVDFYDAKGWKIGTSTMKDWRAAVRTWEKRDQRNPQPPTPSPKPQPKDEPLSDYYRRMWAELQKEFAPKKTTDNGTGPDEQ